MEVSKSDWKLFRVKVAEWQEAYMEKLVNDYVLMLTGEEKASEKFWTLEKRIKKDKRHPGVLIELRKSTMIDDLVYFIRSGVITIDDISDFSEELKEAVNLLVSRRSDIEKFALHMEE